MNKGMILDGGAAEERGQDGTNGEPGADGVRGTSTSDLGTGGRRGSDATSGSNGGSGGNGYVLKLIVFGDASLTDGFILMDGGSGGGGGKGGQGGAGGTWKQLSLAVGEQRLRRRNGFPLIVFTVLREH
jgi:hypothetical protein